VPLTAFYTASLKAYSKLMSSLKLLKGVVYFLLFCLGSTILPESYSQNSTLTLPKSTNKTPDSYTLYEHPGRMIRLPRGNLLSLYCEGKGEPTIMLETGFGGGAYAAWYRLEPRLAKITRTCSYDRAGYGFSELGNDLPRDLYHDVSDLYGLLKASGEPAPYILVGHLDGGHIIGAFADSHPQEVAGLVFLDAAVLVDKQQVEGTKEKPSPSLQKHFSNQFQQIRTCLKCAEKSAGHLEARPGDYCLDSEKVKRLPPDMAKALIEISSRPDSWRAFLSEAEQHYLVDDDSWEVSLLPHRWQEIPILVFTASVASLDDAHSAAAYGLPPSDHKAIEAARTGRK